MFTIRSVMNREFSNKYENIEIDRSRLGIKTTAVIASISREKGIHFNKSYYRSVDTVKFIEYLKLLRNKSGSRRISLFMDNLSVHKSNVVREEMSKLNIYPIFNCPYWPEGNPIELVFS